MNSTQLTDLKYRLYENSVQSPEPHVELLTKIASETLGREARSLREDFCGTFALSCEWVKADECNVAFCVDLDSEPLQYGFAHHYRKLKPDQKDRISVARGDALTASPGLFDMIIACNFSFFILKKRAELLRYFKTSLASLGREGILVLEMAGGAGMVEKSVDRRVIHLRKNYKYTYFWDQKHFDPITHDAVYAIHFKLPDGTKLKDAFTYDWRLWTIPELKDLLIEAGFDDTCVYWETEHKGKPTGEFARMEHGDNSHSWIAQVIGIKGIKSDPGKTPK